jgi:hypothetical protein
MNLTTFQKRFVASVMLVLCVNFFMGCNRYFKPVVVNTPTAETKQASLKKLSTENKYFIVRNKDHSYAMKNLVWDESNMALNASLNEIPKEHLLYTEAVDDKYKVPKKGRPEDALLQEVHLFVSDSTALNISHPLVLPLSAVEKIEVIENDKQRTRTSYAWGAVGITLGAALVVVAIAAIISASLNEDDPQPAPSSSEGSCPYISTLNGDEFELQGEIYSGAIYPALQKDDYLPLKMTAENGAYNLKISNDLREIQYTDFADLVVAEHDKNVRLLVDPQGNMHSVMQPQLAATASLNNNIDVSKELSKIDYNSCLFKDDNGPQNNQDLYLVFDNSLAKTKGKLIINARTSSWFIYLYNEFTKGFGSRYNSWVKEQEKKPASELQKWIDEQNIPLTISVKTANGWKEVNKLTSIGPLLNREVVIPLDNATGEKVEVKISGGYLFWELDYAAIDYSDDAPFTLHEIKPYEAINEKGLSVLPELQNADKKYMVQQTFGDSTMIKYKEAIPTVGMAQTFFFHTSGYYNHPREHTGTPKVGFLKSFQQPGALSAFSKRKFSEPLNSLATAKN